MFTKEHALWFIIGLVFALFVLPLIQNWFASRQTGA